MPLTPKDQDGADLGFLLALKSILGILRLFLSFSNGFELSRKGFALALGEVYFRLLLIDLDGPGLQLLLLDLDLVMERTGLVCQWHFQSRVHGAAAVNTFQAFLNLFKCLFLLCQGVLVFLYFLGLAFSLRFILFNGSLPFGVRVLLLRFFVSESSSFVRSVSAYLRDCFLQFPRLGLRVFDFLFEANVFFLFLGQVLSCFDDHCLELFVRLLTLLVIRLQNIVVC